MTLTLITAEEAAARLQICERTLRKLRQSGKIPYIAITGRTVRYTVEDCDEFLEAARRVDTPSPGTLNTAPRRQRADTGGDFMVQRDVRRREMNAERARRSRAGHH